MFFVWINQKRCYSVNARISIVTMYPTDGKVEKHNVPKQSPYLNLLTLAERTCTEQNYIKQLFRPWLRRFTTCALNLNPPPLYSMFEQCWIFSSTIIWTMSNLEFPYNLKTRSLVCFPFPPVWEDTRTRSSYKVREIERHEMIKSFGLAEIYIQQEEIDKRIRVLCKCK